MQTKLIAKDGWYTVSLLHAEDHKQQDEEKGGE